MIVDDSLSSLTLLSELIVGEGWDVISVQSPEQALSVLASARPDLILLDVDMPGMSGLELCTEIKRQPAFKDVPVLFQSVLTDSNVRVKGLKAGAADFVSKPYQPDEILMRVRIHLKLRALQTRLEDEVAQRTQQLTAEIDERRQIESTLIRSKHELQNLAAHLQDIRETERKHIAREIHDELGQTLSLAQIELKRLAEALADAPEDTRKLLDSALSSVEHSSRTARALSENLRPGMLDALGLQPALAHHIKSFARQSGIQCHYAIDLNDSLDLDEPRATAVFRIVQEALTNVAKHANASRVTVKISASDEEILVMVQDDGIGMRDQNNSATSSYGLVGMRERVAVFGGELIIDSQRQTGTRVEAYLPMELSHHEH